MGQGGHRPLNKKRFLVVGPPLHFNILWPMGTRPHEKLSNSTPILWFQLEDMFQLIVTPQGIEKVTIQLKVTPKKVYAVGAKLFYQRCP